LPTDEPIKSLRLPERKEHEIVLIKLADGTVVARTRAELAPTPPPKPA